MQYSATAKYTRTSTRKVRKVADLIRNQKVTDALDKLSAMSYLAAGDVKKVLESAIANAKQKNIDIQDLFIKTIEIMGGPALKRWRAVSRGRSHGYKKRMTHIKIIIEDKKDIKKKESK